MIDEPPSTPSARRVVMVTLAIAATALALLLGTAWQQARTAEPSPASASAPALPGTAGTLILTGTTSQITVLPTTGQAPGLEASFDPERYTLVNRFTESGTHWRWEVGLEPTGSGAMALLRMKMGGDPPRLRILIPAEIPVSLQGRLEQSLLALEIGGASVQSVDLAVTGGAVTLSVAEATREPMDLLVVSGRLGSLEVTGLGHASPRRVELTQSYGALDLDLRGGWRRDADIRLGGRLAGGTVWLPSDVRIEGLDAPLRPVDPETGLAPVTLHLSGGASLGRFVVFD